jgi:two-component system CheB/CheR fusion protein
MKNYDHIIVGIGASAGGLESLQKFFSALPEQKDAAFVVVMHLLRDHTSQLDSILSRVTPMPVLRIEPGLTVESGKIYVLPEGKYLEIRNNKLQLIDRDYNGINRAVDVFFSSLAEDAGRRAIGIIMSGTGTDGTNGIKQIERHGGFAMVEDPKSSKFTGMPVSAIKFDHPDVVETPEKLAKFIDKYSFSFRQELRA